MTMERVGTSVSRLMRAGAARIAKAALGTCPAHVIISRLKMMREDLVPERMAPLSVLMNPEFRRPEDLTRLVAGWEYELNEDTVFFSSIEGLRTEIDKMPSGTPLSYNAVRKINASVQAQYLRPKSLTRRPK